jgi:hydroxypyruvate isomerase
VLAVWEILERLQVDGYEGAIGLEYEPAGPTERSLAFMRQSRALALFA